MNRRAFLRTMGAAALAQAIRPEDFRERPGKQREDLPVGPLVFQEGAAKRPPNVIAILADDLGSVDLGCYGSKDIDTPSLDALAGRGVRLTQFYVGAPVCSPSRAAFLTGRYPQRAQLDRNAGGTNAMPGQQVTLAEVLKAAGYRTAVFGKWHLGTQPGSLPREQGFDEFRGHLGGCIDNYSHFFYWSGPNQHDLWHNETEVWEEGTFFPDIIVREATRFLTENRDRSFFLYLPFNVPHYPYQGQAKWRERYKDLPYPRNHYAAFVSTVDEKIGQVLAKVDELGLRENTLIVFFSDNGHSTEIRAMGGGGSAGPYRGEKFSLFEGGIRLPCLVSLPGRLPEGQVRDQVAASVDLLPTIAQVCGAKVPERRLDGASLGALLLASKAPSPHTQFHWQTGNQWAVRDGPWKLVVNGRGTEGDDKTFLANLDEDVGEKTNLAKQHPDIVARLKALHEAWVKDVKEQ